MRSILKLALFQDSESELRKVTEVADSVTMQANCEDLVVEIKIWVAMYTSGNIDQGWFPQSVIRGSVHAQPFIIRKIYMLSFKLLYILIDTGNEFTN